MKKLSKRHFLLTAVALPALGLMVPQAFAAAVDTAALYAAPAYGDMSMGPADAKVTIVEYASATCPHCAAFAKDSFPRLKKDYIDTNKIRYIFREFPLDPVALAAFMVARCAPKDKYFGIVDALFATQADWAPNPLPGLTAVAQQAGMSKEQFEACIKNEELAKNITDVREKGAGFGVKGVPAFFINGELIEGDISFDSLRAKIDPLLQ